jgi:hypothetical protein
LHAKMGSEAGHGLKPVGSQTYEAAIL